MKNVITISIVYKLSKKKIYELVCEISKQNIFRKQIFIIDNSVDNLGYGGGINKALRGKAGSADYFLILNPDVKLKKNAVQEMVMVMESNAKIGIVGPKILDEKGAIWSVGGELDTKRYTAGLIGLGKKNKKIKKILYPDFVSGTAMLIRKGVFKKIGFFAEDYFLYYEDVDFCLRAKNAGFLLAIAPEAEIVHYASSSVGENSPLMQYYMARNHLLFAQRFAPLFVKMYEIIRLPKTIFQARKRPYELLGIRDFFLRRFGKNEHWS